MSIWPIKNDLKLPTCLCNLVQPTREAILLLDDEDKLFIATVAG